MDFNENNIAKEQSTGGLKRSSKSTVFLIFAVVLFLLSSTILAATILYFDSMNKKDAEVLQPEIEEIEVEATYTQTQVDQMLKDAREEAAGNAREKACDEMKETLKNASEESSGVLFLLRNYYSDYIIFTESGSKYGYYPIDRSLKPLTIDLDKLLYDDDLQRMTYNDEATGTVGHMGIDVSSHQKDIDWKKVKESGVEFAMIRCAFRGYGSGKLVEDDYFTKNMSGAIANGIKVGVYFYSQAITDEEAIEEAKFTLDLIAPYKVTLPVVIDIEEVNDSARTDDLTVEERTSTVKTFCDTISDAGYEAMIYSNLRFFVKSLDVSKLDDYEKWYAMYNDTIYYPYDISIWQYTANGKVDGISGNVDLNISFKDWGD